ncbi:hypothetical protein RJ639_012306 [Escallonia herrerae]|uniref:Uncharacterized protein n=1 Tax=Escallonia herrerae TaxID=1293975 RepID=A0AA89ARC6_9ASTE|nr:hypothetical protein RJ639_012306 [Escallonia herrerae]
MASNTLTKYDLEKFDGSNNFSLWRMKMHAVLIQQRLLKALKGNQGLPEMMSADEKEDSTDTGAAAATSSSGMDSDSTKLWHMSERGMDVLSKQGKDHGAMEKVELEVRALDSLPKIPTEGR